MLTKKLAEVISFGLPIDIIATSHGVIWREDPMQIVGKYSKWADNYQENQISIIYDTMWDGTKQLAEKIAEGIGLADKDVAVKLFNLAKSDDNDVITEVFKSKTVIVGSPTVGNSVLHSVAGFIHLMKGLKFKNKKAAAFGCYGWSGEGVKVISESMKNAGFELIDEEGLRNLWNPNESVKAEAVKFGMKIAKA
jgi:flavorubredoxin